MHVYLTNNLELHEKRWFRYSKWVLWLNKNTWILLLLFFRLITCLKWSIKWFINSNPKLPLNWNKNYLLPFWKQFLNRTFDMQLQKRLIIFYTQQHTIYNLLKLKSPWNSRDTSYLVCVLKIKDIMKRELVLGFVNWHEYVELKIRDVWMCIFFLTKYSSQMDYPLRSILALPITNFQFILEKCIFIFQLNMKIIND